MAEQHNITSLLQAPLTASVLHQTRPERPPVTLKGLLLGWAGSAVVCGVTDSFCLLTSRIMNDLFCLPANCRMLELIGIKADKINKTELRMSMKIYLIYLIKFNIIIQV